MALLMRKNKIPGWAEILEGGDIPKVEADESDAYAFLQDTDDEDA